MMVNVEEKMRKIRIQEPFIRTMRIKDLKPLLANNAISGETFHVFSKDGKDYKLRYCDSLVDAWRIERNVKKMPHLFPHFFGREGRYLLFEWLPGATLAKDSPLDKYEELGRLYGQIHEINDTGDFKKARRFFEKIASYLLEKDIVGTNTGHKLLTLYDQKAKKAKHKVVLEFTDVHVGNVMVHPRTNKLVIIDEEGLSHKVKGLGMAKSFIRFFTPEQREAFLKGYKSVHSADYFDADYEDFLTLYMLARDVYDKHTTDRPIDKPLKRLLEYLAKN